MTYDYRCFFSKGGCGNQMNVKHPMAEDPEVLCPECSKVMERQLFPTKFKFHNNLFGGISGDEPTRFIGKI
ncbi:MAG: zinc ribbon domain-containing protein [Bacteroidetes bacterium]|nr:zinc ribbon domain-containing protein [Bacteroidota bacterium]